jgi:predicted amidohydrolase
MEWIDDAVTQGIQLLVFPELGLTGYFLKDLTLEVARSIDHPEIKRMVEASNRLDLVFSFIEESRDHRFYVAAVYASKGQVVHVHRKLYLPTYGMFEEGRHFAKGDSLQAFDTEVASRVGMAICEDAWHPSIPYLLSVAGVDVMVIPSAGPGRALSGDPNSGSQQFWHRLIRTYAQLFTSYVVFVNRVGFEDGVFFFGHSAVAGPDGELVASTASIDERLLAVDVDLDLLRKERYRSPFLRDEDPHLTLRMLTRLLGRE